MAGLQWDRDALKECPAARPAAGFFGHQVEACFLEGLPWRGAATELFAWVGIPRADYPVPAVVLVHGGGGMAFEEWVRVWNRRGYAAIAIDHCGATPGGSHGSRPRHERGGPPGCGGFDQLDEPVEDQWGFHAVAAIHRAAAYLAAQPLVDCDHIGLVGVAWGAFLACIAAGVAPRFDFATMVYGCGGVGGSTGWPPPLYDLSPVQAASWCALWEPLHYLPSVTCPTLWLGNPHDLAFPPTSVAASAAAASGPTFIATKPGLSHGHVESWPEPEPYALAAAVWEGAAPLPSVIQAHIGAASLSMHVESPLRLMRGELCVTSDRGPARARAWQILPARLDPTTGDLSASLPADATVAYLNAIDIRGCTATGPLFVAPGADEWRA